MDELLSRSIDELDLSVRSANCLKNANIHTLRDLVRRSEKEMLETKNFGRKSLEELQELLAKLGLSFSMDVPAKRPGVAGRELRSRPCATRSAIGSSGRTTAHRQAMFRNQLASLIEHGRIRTTLAKAKELRPIAERLITRGRQDTVHARRLVRPLARRTAVLRQAVRRDRSAVHRPAGRLPPHPQAGPPHRRRRRDGVPGVRRLRARGEGEREEEVAPRAARPRASARFERPWPSGQGLFVCARQARRCRCLWKLGIVEG